ncbi:uncharacterized protein V1518DRAFT_413461 [Limtongia smithiae]|uniref:uncharacterized protein n=1 Tax=Limtongia smithiae TaxID=1125753 RepID=UPI0034CFDDC0
MANIFRPSPRGGSNGKRSVPGASAPARQAQIKSEAARSQGSVSPAPSSPASAASASAPRKQYTDYRLRAFTENERAGKRFHVMKFNSRQVVDPSTFAPPVTMLRKDPRSLRYQQQQNPLSVKREDGTEVKTEGGVDANGVKMEGGDKATGEMDDGSVAPDPEANVAPDGNGRRNKRNLFQKKTRQVYTGHEEQRQLRYEEHYPWLVEDFDGKNTWVGNYEASQSDCYVLFVFDDDGFKVVPAEKWYKFTPRNRYATLSIEEAEEAMAKKSQPSRWLMKHLHPDEEAAEAQPARKRLRTVDSQSARPVKREEDDDADEIDFDEEFDDDEEAPIMEGPEDENKEIEQRMKRQMRSKENDEDDNSRAKVVSSERRINAEGKQIQESLFKFEQNAIYDPEDEDDEEDPFAGQSGF